MGSKGEYYGNFAGSSRRRRRSIGVMTLLDAALLVVSIVLLVCFVTLLLVPRFTPEQMGMFAALGLYSLYLYMAMLIMVLYWVVRWRLINATIMGLVLFVGLFSLPSYYKIEIDKQHPTKYPRSFKLLTYNLDEYNLEGRERGFDSLCSFVFRELPNIVTLQNAYDADSIDSVLLIKRFKQMPYTKHRRNEALAIYSRYPFAKNSSVDSLQNIIWSDIVAEDDTIRIFNLSLHINNYPVDSLTGERIIPSCTVGERMKRWSVQSKQRAKQIEELLPYIESSPYPYVIAGSINDIPSTFVYRRIAAGRLDAYVEKGFGYSHTYRGYDEGVRLDYVFLSPDVEVLSYEVLYDVDLSLHYPIFVRFNYESQQKK